MKIKFLLILPVVLSILSLYSQQTLNVTGGGLIIMKENVRMVVDSGVGVSTGSEIKVDTSILSLNAGSKLADYEGIEVGLGNTTGLTLVPGSFKSTPVAVDDSYLASENTLLSVLAASGLLQNDFDDNIPGLNVTAFDNTSAEGGTVMVNADGSFSYDPPMDFTGEDSFSYTVTDSDGQMNSGVVSIRVN